MSWTKQQFIVQAFNQIGISSYEFDQSPSEYELALQVLDSMMASWNANGIRIAYPLPNSPSDSYLSQNSFVPDAANEAIYTNLAIRLAPSYGKAASQDLLSAAKSSYATLCGRFNNIPIMQFPSTTPAGAGNKWWRYTYNPFLRRPISPPQSGPDGYIEANIETFQGNQGV